MTRVPHVVRHGEHAVELRLGRTTASFYRFGEPMTGSLWDLCAWPVLEFDSAPSVLILGLGAGSIARAIRHLRPRAAIAGVEIDSEVVAVARREFGLDELSVDVVIEDAVSFLEHDDRRYELVIDDVFLARDGTLEKPGAFSERWEALVVPRVAARGIIVTNTIDEPALERVVRRCFSHVIACRCSDAHNRVLVASDHSLETLESALATHPALAAVASTAAIE